jgi:ABC-type nickel/cobalt efflux system permease component RcnA
MAACPNCGAELPNPPAAADAPHASHHHHIISSIFAHIPHPHIHHRKKSAPKTSQEHQPEPRHLIARFNAWFAVKVTDAVGTMWCAYAFAALAMVSLPDAVHGGTATLVAWIAQTFIQLVLLSIIIVGQKVASEASDKRAIDTYNDAEAVLHEAVQIQQHLAAQDAFLQRLIDELCEKKKAADLPPDRPA